MKITVATQAYNAGKYIEKCIQSVLSQTYSDFEYFLIDNGSTDGSRTIMEKYAKSDSRINLITYDENGKGRWYSAVVSMGTGDYFMMLDADDWLEPDCLERMTRLVKETNLEIVTTGSYMHIEGTNQVEERKFEISLTLEKKDFANYFPYYHVYFRAMWAKLIKIDYIKNAPLLKTDEIDIAYGIDTLQAFSWLRQANRICIDNSILHHYRINQKSVSHQYDPRQSYSDIYLFNDALDFLSPYGPVSENNLIFLHRVYSNAINDTLSNIVTSALSYSEKAEEYRKILERKVTEDCFKRTLDDIIQNKGNLFYEIFKTLSNLGEVPQNWNELFIRYFPKCGRAVSIRFIKLALLELNLFRAFIYDDALSLVKLISGLISQNKYVKQFPLPQILQALAQSNPLLSSITDAKFIKKYGEIYLILFQSKYGDALDAMTDVLLKEKVNSETFLQTYLNVAALMERADEFIFGKIKTAGFFLSEKRFDECKEVLDEIAEMGVEDNEEIISLKSKLNQQTY